MRETCRVAALACLLAVSSGCAGAPKRLFSLRGSRQSLDAVAFSPDSRLLATGGRDNAVRVWDVAQAGESAVFEGHANDVSSVLFLPGGRRLLSGSQDGTVRLWDLDSSTHSAVGTPQGAAITAMALAPDGRRVALAMGFGDGSIRFWDTQGWKDQGGAIKADKAWLSGLAYSDAGHLESIGFDPVVRSWGGPGPAEHEGLQGSGQALAFSHDGLQLAASGQGGRIHLWGPGAARTWPGRQGVILALAFSVDGVRLASGGLDGTLRLWESATGRRLAALTLGAPVTAIAFSPDRKLLAASLSDGSLVVYRIGDGAIRAATGR